MEEAIVLFSLSLVTLFSKLLLGPSRDRVVVLVIGARPGTIVRGPQGHTKIVQAWGGIHVDRAWIGETLAICDPESRVCWGKTLPIDDQGLIILKLD